VLGGGWREEKDNGKINISEKMTPALRTRSRLLKLLTHLQYEQLKRKRPAAARNKATRGGNFLGAQHTLRRPARRQLIKHGTKERQKYLAQFGWYSVQAHRHTITGIQTTITTQTHQGHRCCCRRRRVRPRPPTRPRPRPGPGHARRIACRLCRMVVVIMAL